MIVLVRDLPGFRHQRTGSFRRWLKTITLHRLQNYLRSRRHAAGTASCPLLEQLADPNSDLSRQWDEEHNRHVIRRLLELIEGEFTPTTIAAFRRVVLDQQKPAVVAAELGISRNAILGDATHTF
jgi:RNA polymerase sigma-70 factor (ECF subfamily)